MLPLPADAIGLAHEIRIPNYFRRLHRGRISSHERRQAINQASPAPVHQLLSDAMQPVLFTQRAKHIRCHAWVPMMRPVENLRLDQWFGDYFRQPFTRRVNVLAEIRMMNETFATHFHFGPELAEIFFDHITVRVHERIETENEIH
jgi:hypothetical protein